MLDSFDQKTIDEIKNFSLPSYSEIPNVGLFLEQVTKYICEYISPFEESISLTGSMISNYVKKGIIKNPVKKQYAREEIAYLFFIAISKSILSLEDVQMLLKLQTKVCSCESAYEFFRAEFKSSLLKVFKIDAPDIVSASTNVEEKIILQNTITTICHKIYLDKYFSMLSQNDAN